MPQYVYGDRLIPQRRTDVAGRCDVRGEPALECIATERPPRARGEQCVARLTATFGEPGAQRRDHGRREWRDPLLPSFPLQTADMWPSAQMDVAAAQSNELRDSQASLDRRREHRLSVHRSR